MFYSAIAAEVLRTGRIVDDSTQNSASSVKPFIDRDCKQGASTMQLSKGGEGGGWKYPQFNF